MGLFKFLLLSFLPVTGFATVLSLRLGPELPKATRATGRRIGMLYNYLKVVLKLITPKSHSSVEVVRKLRQSGQQAFAMSNEIKWNLLDLKPEVKRILPDLTQDPIGLQSLVKQDNAEKVSVDGTGTGLLRDVFAERRRVSEDKAAKQQSQDTFLKL